MTDGNDNPSPEDAIAILAQLVGLGWQWWWSVVNELQHLPEVLQQMRQGAESFEQVARQLANSTATFEQIVEVYGKTLLDAAERNAAMTEAVQRRLEGLSTIGAGEQIGETVSEMQKVLSSLAGLNPLWPGHLLGRSEQDQASD